MATYAIVNSGGNVLNVINWNGTNVWQPPPGTTAVQVPAGRAVSAGWTYANGQFSAPPAPPVSLTQAQLIAYAIQKRSSLVVAGFTVTTSAGAVIFSADVGGLALLGAAATRLTEPTPPASFLWRTGLSSFVTLTAADIPTSQAATEDFAERTLATLQTVMSGIAGSTITTTAQIDAAAWPANH